MLACGVYHTVIQDEKNEVYVCGDNYHGQLGLGDRKNRNEFEKVEYDFGKIKNIACGGYHTVIQNEKNEIYVCGNNYHGQLGLGDNENRNKFEKVDHNFGKIKNIACGEFYMIIQNEKSEIYVCGRNLFGQLGLGDNKNRNKFEKVGYNFGEIKNMMCGDSHIVIQNEKNEIYVCGDNRFGQLGLGDNNGRNKFEKVKKNFGEIKNIVCSRLHTIIQNDKNDVYVCGYNGYGQLGLGDKKDRNKFEKAECDFGGIKNITCGRYHTIIQNEKNEIYACGWNVYGQLGFGDNKDRNKYEKVEYDFGEIKNIACGLYHTIIQNEKNEIYVCGYNKYGQLGLGDKEDRNKFEKVECDFGKIKKIACGGYHIIIQNEKNDIYVCGYNGRGNLGLGDNENRNKFEKVNTNDIFEKMHHFVFQLNTEEIVL